MSATRLSGKEASKEFTIRSESGSKLLIERVFKKVLQSEKEAVAEENQRGSNMVMFCPLLGSLRIARSSAGLRSSLSSTPPAATPCSPAPASRSAASIAPASTAPPARPGRRQNARRLTHHHLKKNLAAQ